MKLSCVDFQDSYRSLVEDYEALVSRWFIGRYYGIRRGKHIEADFAVFKMDKYQPTHHAKRFRRDMYKLNEIDRVSILFATVYSGQRIV